MVLLGKSLGWKSLTGEVNFKDSSSIQDWSIGYVLAATERSVISGYEDNTFRPDKQVTRAEMAVMITNALSLPSSDNIKASQVFTDGRKIPYWAESQVSATLAAGIMKGDSNKNFRPLNIATRAENAAMFGSVLGYLIKQTEN
ncbi:MAG: S-layer homology domain-containing protein [Peptococcaceae bacterium]|nr:S-layer homology domain-containing protein [Peptococcaceae bacterium]